MAENLDMINYSIMHIALRIRITRKSWRNVPSLPIECWSWKYDFKELNEVKQYPSSLPISDGLKTNYINKQMLTLTWFKVYENRKLKLRVV